MATKEENSIYLKTLIANAMIDLMLEKSYKNFTITELTERAGVGRVTYFRHFSSKEDVLIFKLKHLWQQHAEHENFPLDDIYAMALWFFTYCDENKELLTLIHNANLDIVLIQTCLDITMPHDQGTDNIGKELFSRAFYSYGMVGIMIQSVKTGFKYSPKQLADIFVENV